MSNSLIRLFLCLVIGNLFISSSFVMASPSLKQHEILARLPHFSVTAVHSDAFRDLRSVSPSDLPDDISIQLDLESDRQVLLQLHRNKQLFGPEYKELHHGDHGFQLKNNPSQARLSGVVSINGELFAVEPLNLQSRTLLNDKVSHQKLKARVSEQQLRGVSTARHDHLIYRMADLEHVHPNPSLCGTGSADHPHPVLGDPLESSPPSHNNNTEPVDRALPPIPQPLSSGSTAYIELLIVNDKRRFNIFGSNTESYSVSAFNVMQAIYANAPFSVRVNLVLSAQLTWTSQDPYAPSMSGSEAILTSSATTSGLLDLFNSWRPKSGIPHDAAILMSGYDFIGQTVGLAYVGTMCWSSYSGAIAQATSSSAPFVAAIASHELGHVLSAQHDSVGNSCPSSGFIMNAILSSPPSTWSSCSVSTISNFLQGVQSSCLVNLPAVIANVPTTASTTAPTQAPSTQTPTQAPTQAPTQSPTQAPTLAPTQAPTQTPTQAPTQTPTQVPTQAATQAPTTKPPTAAPTTVAPTTAAPTTKPPTTTQPAPTAAPTTSAPISKIYAWATSPFSPCTRQCGSGVMLRSVYCYSTQYGGVVADSFCSGIPKPPSVVSCNSQACLIVPRAVTALSVEEASRLALESIPVAAAAVSSTTFALIAAGIIAVLAGVFACGCYRQQVAIAREGHLHAEKAEVMKTPAHAGSVHFDASKNSNSASNISQHHRRNSSRFGVDIRS